MAIGHVIILLIFVVLGVYVATALEHLVHQLDASAQLSAGASHQINALEEDLLAQLGFEEKYLIAKDDDYRLQFERVGSSVQEGLVRLAAQATSAEMATAITRIQTEHQRYQANFRLLTAAITAEAGGDSGHRSARDALFDEIFAYLEEARRLFVADHETQMADLSRSGGRLLRISLLLGIAALALGVGVAFVNARSIDRTLKRFQHHTREITQGRFETLSQANLLADFQNLAEAFNRMSRRLAELDQLKLDFISHVSHEMRTPLTAINEASALLAEGRFQEQPAQHRELLAIIRDECSRLTRSINGIMDLSRMEAGMMTFQFQPGDLVQLIHACVKRMMPVARRQGIELIELPPPEMPQFNFDSRHIDQALGNILGNALKFTPRGGQVVVEISRDRTGFATVMVSDSGPGISAEHLERIFDKFKRIDNGADSIYGSGVGLSVAKHVISAHKGSIWAESRPGTGARFVFTLPLA